MVIPEGYKPNQLPIIHPDEMVEIKVNAAIVSVYDIKEWDLSFRVKLRVQLVWFDPR